MADLTTFEESLILYLRGHVGSSELSDFTIVSKDQQKFPCSKLLLSARSKYYQALFRQEPSQTTSNLDYGGDVLRLVLSSLVTVNFEDCSFDQLLELLEVVDFLQMPEMLSEVETTLSEQLNIENIHQVMASNKIYISSLMKIQGRVCQLIKRNILFLDLDSVPEDWLNSVATAPFANVRGKNGRILDVVESELIVAMTLSGYNPDKEWIFSSQSKENIARGLLKISFRINQMRSGIKPGKVDRGDNYENFLTLIHGNGEKLEELMGKYCTTEWNGTGGIQITQIYQNTPDHTKVYSNKQAYGTAEDRRYGNGEPWEITGFFRKIYVREGLWDGRQVVRWIHFLTEEGELLAPPGMEQVNSEVTGDTQEAKLNWLEKNTTVLTVPEGQHIKDVILRSGWYIDQIGFVTNTGEILGPVGGTGGAQRDVYEDVCKTDARMNFGLLCLQYYICGVDGMIYEEGGTPLIARLRFSFAAISCNQDGSIRPGVTQR